MALQKSSPNIPTITSPSASSAFNDETEDFTDDWGGFGDAAETTTTNDNNEAEDDEEEDPWGSPAITTSKPTTSYNDNGEPDFAGWLAAQNQSKKKATNTSLPKGLTKTTPAAAGNKTSRPGVGARSSTAGSLGMRKSAAVGAGAGSKKEAPAKKEVVKKEESKEEEDEGWGDAW